MECASEFALRVQGAALLAILAVIVIYGWYHFWPREADKRDRLPASWKPQKER